MPDEKTGRPDEQYVVQMKGITKVYPNGVAANQGVDFFLRRGEIHALMGENGAGKSTLMKMLFGLEQPTSGEIWVNGEKLSLTSPTVAISHGIGMVHQHFMLVPSLTVAENMVLGMAPRKGLFIDHAKAVAITKEYAEKYNLHVEPEAKVMDIPVGMKQKVEILKALVRGAKILILDEPTAVLTTQETVELFKELRHLKEQGYTIVFISHKLREVMEICDTYTVLRDGVMVASGSVKDVTTSDLARFMVGHDVRTEKLGSGAQRGEERLSLRGLTQEPHFRNIDLTAYAGEVLGVAGLVGSRRTELLSTIFGIMARESGEIKLNGKPISNKTPRQSIKNGFAMLTEERRATGIFPYASILFNTVISNLGSYQRGPLLSDKKMTTDTDWSISSMHIKTPSQKTLIKNLSGGNQQKVILGRWLLTKPDVLLLDEPTRGIDVGAKYEIYELILQLAKQGKAVMMVSSEMPELIGICDRILVMSNGHMAGILERGKDFGGIKNEQETIMRLAAQYV